MGSTRLAKRRAKRQQETEMEHILNTDFTLIPVSPITERQKNLFKAFRANKNIANIGSAGTGKTFLSLYLAFSELLNTEDYDKVVIARSSVQTRDQGFMPGNAKEKMENYESLYIDLTNELFDRDDAYRILKQRNMVQFMSTSFSRGLSINRSIIIVDECQNMAYNELRTMITRVGKGSRIIFCGDTKQDDLVISKNKNDKSGLPLFLEVLSLMDKKLQVIEFNSDDIVRSELVKDFIIAEEKLSAKNKQQQ